MDDILITAGKYAGAISAVIGLIGLIAWKPLKKARAKVRSEKAAQLDFQRQVLDGLKSISEDVGDLQFDRLTQAHDHYLALGYCPSATKQALVKMHKSYRAKGRNHLTDHYEEDILELPTQETRWPAMRSGRGEEP